MAKIHFDAATKRKSRPKCLCDYYKRKFKRYAFTHDLGEMDNHSAEWHVARFGTCTRIKSI